MRACTHIVTGHFFGADIEPGTFHHFIPPERREPSPGMAAEAVKERGRDGGRSGKLNRAGTARTGEDVTDAPLPQPNVQEATREA